MGQDGPGPMGHHTTIPPHDHDKRRPLLRLALALLIVATVGLHAGGVLFLAKTGLRGLLPVPTPILYILLGVALAGALFKLTHVLHLLRRWTQAVRDKPNDSGGKSA